MKKLASLLLVLVMVCASVAALAGSISTGDMTTVTVTTRRKTTTIGDTDVPLAGASINVITEPQMTADQKAVYDSALAAISAVANPADYFGDTAKAEIEGLLPGIDVSTLQMNELAGIIASGYGSLTGSLTINCKFPTQYAAGQKVVVMIGILTDGEMVWKAFPGTVLADGSIDVDLPAEIIKAIEDGMALISVLNA